MPDAPEIVQTLQGISFLRKWWRTLRVARGSVKRPQQFSRGLGVRVGSLRDVRRPVFILGCPRSGTTYLGSLLEALPSTTYFYEPPVMKYYARLVYEGLVSRRQAGRFYRRCFHTLMLAAPSDGTRIVEKNPPHTWIAETLYGIFPDAQFVVISRDGRDVSVSLREKPWHRRDSLGSGKREPGGYLYGPYPHFYIERNRSDEYIATTDLHRCIWIWRRFAEEIERLRSALPARCQHHIRYEELILEPERTLDALLSFLGEADSRSRQRVLDAAAHGHDASIGRWREVLTDVDLEIIHREGGDMMRLLGYPEDPSDVSAAFMGRNGDGPSPASHHGSKQHKSSRHTS